MKKFLALAVTMALSAPVTALAQNTQLELTSDQFAQLDKNKDGKISRDEYEAFMRNAYKKLDTDGNNSLSRAEAGKVLTPEQFTAADKDKSGELSLDELINQVMADFDRADLNKDGSLQR